MKTTSQKKNSELVSRSAQLSSTTTEAQSAVAPKPDTRLPIDSEARMKNRTLPTDKVLALLHTVNPDLFNLAEVSASGFGFQFKTSPQPPCGSSWRSLVSIGTVSGRHGSTRAAHFVCAAQATRTKSIRPTTPATRSPHDIGGF